jgi:hypothetical protein
VLEQELIKGQKSEVVPLPAGRLKDLVMTCVPDVLARFITNACRQGSFLITAISKPSVPA